MKKPSDPGKIGEPSQAEGVQAPVLSRAARALRYEAQIIMDRYGKRFEEAVEIARHVLAEKARADQTAAKIRRAERRVRAEQRHDRQKREDNPYPVHGPALQGGIPGLGKRK